MSHNRFQRSYQRFKSASNVMIRAYDKAGTSTEINNAELTMTLCDRFAGGEPSRANIFVACPSKRIPHPRSFVEHHGEFLPGRRVSMFETFDARLFYESCRDAHCSVTGTTAAVATFTACPCPK